MEKYATLENIKFHKSSGSESRIGTSLPSDGNLIDEMVRNEPRSATKGVNGEVFGADVIARSE